MTSNAPDPEPELEANYPLNISPPPYDQHENGRAMESKSPPPIELIVTLTNEVKNKNPSIEGTYLNPNSESKNQDWKSDPLKINGRSYWIQDNGLNAIWFDKKINQWNIGEKENLGRDQNYSIKSAALNSYDTDWPHLVKVWFYKDVTLYNDWTSTTTDIIIEQGEMNADNSVKVHTSQPTSNLLTFDPKSEPFDATVDSDPKEKERKRKEQEAKKNASGPSLNLNSNSNFGGNQSRTNNYNNRRDDQEECCEFFCDCCIDLLTSFRRCFRPPQPKWDCCSCDCDCGDCDCDCGDCDCDCND